MTSSPTIRCPRCGSMSSRVVLNLRLCQNGDCATVFLVRRVPVRVCNIAHPLVRRHGSGALMRP